MTKHYAKINNENRVIGIRAFSKIVVSNDLIEIQGYNSELLGQTYNSENNTFTLVEETQPEEPTGNVINIAITSVAPQLTGFDNKPNEYTVSEFTDITATGSGLNALVAMGLTKFRVPFVRTDTMRKAYMVATIAPDGTFNLNINFKSGGKWVVNTELLNSELTPEELALFSFSIDEHVFKVI